MVNFINMTSASRPHAASPAFEFDQVRLDLDGEKLLENVSFKVPKQGIFALMGPSGSGKTLLLKLMAGLLSPSQGKVLVNEKNPWSLTEAQRHELYFQVGMLFQKNALFDSLSVGENVAFPLREKTRLSETEIDQRVTEYLSHVGLLEARHLGISEISGGMQKRLGIARALALQPTTVLYDDPTAGLDPITSRKIMMLIVKLQKQQGATAVIVTNDVLRAFEVADQIAFTFEKSLVFTGNVTETKKHPSRLVQQFIRGDVEGPLSEST
jgi:phospholipid/cholesterol/gamma-HCH transport system ATP-binding protein